MLGFGYTPFSSRLSSDDETTRVDFRASTFGVVGVGGTDYETCQFLTSSQGSANLSVAVYDTFAVAVNTYTTAQVCVNYAPVLVFRTDTATVANIGATAHPVVTYEVVAGGTAQLGENALEHENFTGISQALAYLGSNVWEVAQFSVLTVSNVALVGSIVSIDEIAVTLNAGDELRLDCANYTLTINGENMLHLYEGDFLELSRNLYALNISTGTQGTVEGRLLYQEVWL